MTRIRCFVAALMLPLASPVALTAQAFEGRVTADMQGPSGQAAMPVVMLVKGAKSRMEMSMGGMDMYMIMDGETKSMLSVMPSQRMYMRMDLEQAAQSMQGMGGQHTPPPPPKITRTGRHETIAGRDCEHIELASERGGTMDICAAKGMGFFTGGMGGPMGRGRGAGVPAGYEALMNEFKDGFFPLRIEVVDGTKRTQMMVVKSIEPQRVEASLFVPPADFQEMKMPGMPGMGRP
jgi:hypothetical protein